MRVGSTRRKSIVSPAVALSLVLGEDISFEQYRRIAKVLNKRYHVGTRCHWRRCADEDILPNLDSIKKVFEDTVQDLLGSMLHQNNRVCVVNPVQLVQQELDATTYQRVYHRQGHCIEVRFSMDGSPIHGKFVIVSSLSLTGLDNLGFSRKYHRVVGLSISEGESLLEIQQHLTPALKQALEELMGSSFEVYGEEPLPVHLVFSNDLSFTSKTMGLKDCKCECTFCGQSSSTWFDGTPKVEFLSPLP